MKRPLTISFIVLALVISAAGAAPAAHAQPDGTVYNVSANGTYTAQPGAGIVAPDRAAEGIIKSYAPDEDSVFNGVMIRIMSLFAWLLGVAAVTLDYAVYYTVVIMGTYVKDLAAVGVTWQIMRDIGNIVIIFGFLAIGISIILNTERLGYGKKMLPMLLVAAIFLNFSLFISEAVIDTGNLFATQFYTQIKGDTLTTSSYLSNTSFIQQIENEGISNKIMSQLGLATIYGSARDGKVLSGANTLFIGFMSMILFLVAAFVMFSLAFILIARFVILLFLIIIAPIGFAGLAVPRLASAAGRWWDELFTQTLTAPVLLLLLYIALAVITDARFLTGFGTTNTRADAATGFIGNANLPGFASFILSFLVAMGLLLAVVILSKKLSAFGGGWATKWAGRASFGATAFGASALTGGAAFALRRGVVQRFNPTSRLGRGVQRLASRGLRATERARMDIRAIPGVGAGLTAMRLGEASAPVSQSAMDRRTQASQWIRHGGDAANAQIAQETRIPRLGAAISRGDRVEANRLMRTVTDEELRRRDIQNLITTNPLAVQMLTNHQVTMLPDNILTAPNVFQNLTIGQLEAYRAAGNAAPGVAGNPMQVHLLANQYDTVYMGGRNGADRIAIQAFWHI
ncbi:MAG: hypothetical protein Q7R58_02880 [bacterium]|nr:hypothetical protein [bacterium]